MFSNKKLKISKYNQPGSLYNHIHQAQVPKGEKKEVLAIVATDLEGGTILKGNFCSTILNRTSFVNDKGELSLSQFSQKVDNDYSKKIKIKQRLKVPKGFRKTNQTLSLIKFDALQRPDESIISRIELLSYTPIFENHSFGSYESIQNYVKEMYGDEFKPEDIMLNENYSVVLNSPGYKLVWKNYLTDRHINARVYSPSF